MLKKKKKIIKNITKNKPNKFFIKKYNLITLKYKNKGK